MTWSGQASAKELTLVVSFTFAIAMQPDLESIEFWHATHCCRLGRNIGLRTTPSLSVGTPRSRARSASLLRYRTARATTAAISVDLSCAIKDGTLRALGLNSLDIEMYAPTCRRST